MVFSMSPRWVMVQLTVHSIEKLSKFQLQCFIAIVQGCVGLTLVTFHRMETVQFEGKVEGKLRVHLEGDDQSGTDLRPDPAGLTGIMPKRAFFSAQKSKHVPLEPECPVHDTNECAVPIE